MNVTPQQLEQFHRDGYFVVPDFWEAREVAAMREELERLKTAGHLINVVPGQTVEATGKANLQLCPMSDKSTLFRAMPFAPKVCAAISQLIGDPVVLHLDQVFLKPAQHGTGTNWHQDNAYFEAENPLRGVALWTAVHDANAANGTMRVIPGSFREEYAHSKDPDSQLHIRCYPPEERAVTVEVPAGGALFFTYGVAHCTGANTTDSERAGIALHFHNASANPHVKNGFVEISDPVLSGPEATGGEREYGTRVEGTWENEVERVLSAT